MVGFAEARQYAVGISIIRKGTDPRKSGTVPRKTISERANRGL